MTIASLVVMILIAQAVPPLTFDDRAASATDRG
jgi:hypothetical protein